MQKGNVGDYDEMRAFGRLPSLDIEIVHRTARQGQDEYLSVTMRGTPSLDAIGRLLETANPLFFWTRLMQAAWSPWIGLFGGWGMPGRIRGER
jgi:hypothetical protein